MNDSGILTTVLVTGVLVPEMSTVGYAEGTDDSNGDRILFTGDHRPMRELHFAVKRGEQPIVELEPWQISGRFPPKVTA